MEDEIIIHKDQTNIKDFLETNERCPNCRWYRELDGECTDHSLNNEFSKRIVLFEDTSSCDSYYPIDYMELARKNIEDNGLFDL